MIKYTGQLSMPLMASSYKHSPTSPSHPRQLNSARDSKISLTPLWEYVVRTKSLPDGLDLDVFFQAIQERLRNPEREVRQHALRVLTDFMPVIDTTKLDEKMQMLMPDLVRSLGDIGPAVRKGATDCLRVFLNISNKSDNTLKYLIYNVLEKAHENKIKPNIITGIIISLPSLLQKASHESILYTVKMLFEKMVQITYQEVTLRSLVRLRDLLGDEMFDEYIKYSGSSSTRKDFDLLCEVYNVDRKDFNETGIENSPQRNRNYWNDFSQNSIEDLAWRSEPDTTTHLGTNGEIIEDKVILETEIKLNSGPAITMQIHEESRTNISDIRNNQDDIRNGLGIMKILPDEDEYEPRRTPRRVRFGGEVVKLRTPDSDSNQPSDLDNDSTITITPHENNGNKPTIEIHYRDTKTRRSSIPIPNSKKNKITHSEPSSPVRAETKNKTSVLFRSSPNLSKSNVGDKLPIVGSRIPKRKKFDTNTRTTTIQIRLTDFTAPNERKGKPLNTSKIGGQSIQATEEIKTIKSTEKKITSGQKRKNSIPELKLKISEDKCDGDPILSPGIIHKQIEIFHNLTRSPERKLLEAESNSGLTNSNPLEEMLVISETTNEKPIRSLIEQERHLTTADDVLLNRKAIPTHSRNVRTADYINKSGIKQNKETPDVNPTFNSFHVYSSTISESLNNHVDSPIPTNDNGDCLTCSSSGSDNVMIDFSWEELGVVDKTIIHNLNCKDDWKIRLRGLEDLNKVLQNQSAIVALEPKAASLLNFLFSCEQHSRLQSVSEDILKILFSNMGVSTIRGRLTQIVLSLCKIGSPAGVRLSIMLMRRISAEEFLNHLLRPSVLGAKSSKVREGALQILMTISRIFPSTEVNVPKATEFVTPLLQDRKKRVRRASLETIAALAQLGTPGVVLQIISNASNFPDMEQLMRVVRTRLSRKQLPAVDLNGSVRYSTPSEESEIEWISIGSATTSPEFILNNVICDNPQDKTNVRYSAVNNNLNVSRERLNSTYINNNVPNTTLAKIPLAERRENNWKSNTRRVEINENEILNSTENGSEWSEDVVEDKEELKSQNLQIWAVDPWTLSTPVKLSTANGTLRPLYIIQRDQFQTCNNSYTSTEDYNDINNGNEIIKEKRSPRGRSFSPPKSKSSNSIRKEEPKRFIVINNDVGNLKKSCSSDQIRGNGGTFSSSTSSSNSGTSTRNANWNKHFKSGIPVPVSSDSRIRLRTRQGDVCRGPLSIPPQFYRTKSPSPQHTPEQRISVSQRSILVRQPFSSGSESSEFYTPPAEPHLATNFTQTTEDNIVLESPRPSESFIEVDSPRYHNEIFSVIDDSSSDVLDQNKAFTPLKSVHSQSNYSFKVEDVLLLQSHDTTHTEDSFLTQDDCECEEILHIPTAVEEYKDACEERLEDQQSLEEIQSVQRETLSCSLEDLVGCDAPRFFLENRSISKSEVNLQRVPDISRKTVSSAPAMNDILQDIAGDTFDDVSLNCVKTSLPGSVIDCVAPEDKVETPPEILVISKTPRTSIPKSFSRKNSVRSIKKEATPSDDGNLRPFCKPKEGVCETLSLLNHCEWEMTVKGLQGIVRLTRFHHELTETHMHQICVALGRQIRNLRSQVARAACMAASELFCNHKKPLEMELDELAIPLLHRTADTNKFLRGDANMALDKMCLNMPPPRVVSVVVAKGVGHQNAIVRCAAARLLCALTNRLGCEKIFQLPKDTRDKILLSGANLLMEGNLDTRKHSKMMFGNLSGHCQFNKAMMEAVPLCTMRHIQKTLKNLQ